MRISDWSSDVCSSDLLRGRCRGIAGGAGRAEIAGHPGDSGRAFDPQHGMRGGDVLGGGAEVEIGRESGRERVCKYVSISVVAVSFKKKTTTHTYSDT